MKKPGVWLLPSTTNFRPLDSGPLQFRWRDNCPHRESDIIFFISLLSSPFYHLFSVQKPTVSLMVSLQPIATRCRKHRPLSTLIFRRLNTPHFNTTSNEIIVEMARGRSPRHSHRRAADHRSRPRSQERSIPPNQPDSSRFIRQDHSNEHRTQAPSRKELFPDRRPRSRERETRHRDVPDPTDTNNVDRGGHRGTEELHPTASVQEKEFKSITRNDEHHRSRHMSRSASPHINRKRRRERSRSPLVNPPESKHGRPAFDIPKDPRSGVNAIDSNEYRTRVSPKPSFSELKGRHERHDWGHPNNSHPHERESHRKLSHPERVALPSREGYREEQRHRDGKRRDGPPESGKKSSKKRRRGLRRSRSPKHRALLNDRERELLRDYSRSPDPFDSAPKAKHRDKHGRRPSPDASRRNAHSQSPHRDRPHSPFPARDDERRSTPREEHQRIRDRSPPKGDRDRNNPPSWPGPAEDRFSPHRSQRTPSPSGDSGYQRRHRRSRSRSFQSPPAPVDRDRSRREPPDPYNNSDYRTRPYPPPPRHLANSPPFSQYPRQDYHDDWPDRGGWSGYDRGR
jgi:hypothetical protein